MTIIGSYVSIISPLNGQSSGTGVVKVYDPATNMYGLASPVWQDLLYFSRAEFRVLKENFDGTVVEDMWAKLGPWEPTVKRVGPYDHWYGDDEAFVRAVSHIVAKLV